jgi:hypothetical protein
MNKSRPYPPLNPRKDRENSDSNNTLKNQYSRRLKTEFLFLIASSTRFISQPIETFIAKTFPSESTLNCKKSGNKFFLKTFCCQPNKS